MNLRPGETQKISVPLDARSFTYYDVKAKQWRADPGTFHVLLGSSSEQIELSSDVKLEHALTAGN